MRVVSIAFQVWFLVFTVSCRVDRHRHYQERECWLDTGQVLELVEELHLSTGSYKSSDSIFHDQEAQRIANAIGIDSMELSKNILKDPWGAAYIVEVQRGDDGSVVTTVTSEGPTSKKGDGYLLRHTGDENGTYSIEVDRKY